MPVVSTTKMTARQFDMLGDDLPGVRLELVDGEIAVSPNPRPEHSQADKMLSYILMGHIRSHKLGLLLGDVDTVFGDYDVRHPDIIYYRADRAHLIDPKDALRHAPDLCVEILSPGSRVIDRKDKFEQYAGGGVEYYWIVDPEHRTIEAYKLAGGQYVPAGKGSGPETVSLPPFQELTIPLGELWLSKISN